MNHSKLNSVLFNILNFPYKSRYNNMYVYTLYCIKWNHNVRVIKEVLFRFVVQTSPAMWPNGQAGNSSILKNKLRFCGEEVWKHIVILEYVFFQMDINEVFSRPFDFWTFLIVFFTFSARRSCYSCSPRCSQFQFGCQFGSTVRWLYG